MTNRMQIERIEPKKTESERSEDAIREVFKNQFPALTSQILNNMQQISVVGDKWPPILLILLGAGLIVVSLAIKIGFFGVITMGILWPGEFMALIFSGAGLMFAGALFSLYQARSLRKIIKAQQLVGTEILNKQMDIEKDLLTGKHRQQQGQLILLPAKKLKRFRRC